MRIRRGKYIPWWKFPNVLLSTDQMIEIGLIGANRQLKLWL